MNPFFDQFASSLDWETITKSEIIFILFLFHDFPVYSTSRSPEAQIVMSHVDAKPVFCISL